jgi:hypothetical protein
MAKAKNANEDTQVNPHGSSFNKFLFQSRVLKEVNHGLSKSTKMEKRGLCVEIATSNGSISLRLLFSFFVQFSS